MRNVQRESGWCIPSQVTKAQYLLIVGKAIDIVTHLGNIVDLSSSKRNPNLSCGLGCSNIRVGQPIMRFPILIYHLCMMSVDSRLLSSDFRLVGTYFSLVSEISKPLGWLVIPSVEKEETLWASPTNNYRKYSVNWIWFVFQTLRKGLEWAKS